MTGVTVVYKYVKFQYDMSMYVLLPAAVMYHNFAASSSHVCMCVCVFVYVCVCVCVWCVHILLKLQDKPKPASCLALTCESQQSRVEET